MFFGCLPCCGEVQGSCPDPLSTTGLRAVGSVFISSIAGGIGVGGASVEFRGASTIPFSITFSVFTREADRYFYGPILGYRQDNRTPYQYVAILRSSSFTHDSTFGIRLQGDFRISGFPDIIMHQINARTVFNHDPCGKSQYYEDGTEGLFIENSVPNFSNTGVAPTFTRSEFNGVSYNQANPFAVIERDTNALALAGGGGPISLVLEYFLPATDSVGSAAFRVDWIITELYWVLSDGSEVAALRWGFAGIEWQP